MPSKRDTLFGKLDEETQKRINQFVDDYRRIMNAGNTATMKMYEQTQKEAVEKLEDYPDLKEVYEKYSKWRSENKRTPLDEGNQELTFGYIVERDITSIDRDFRPSEQDKEFALNAYGEWAIDNNFIPSDDVLSKFSKIPVEVYEEVRQELGETGYQFEETESGFNVVARPNKQMLELLKLIPDRERDEATKLLSALLETAD